MDTGGLFQDSGHWNAFGEGKGAEQPRGQSNPGGRWRIPGAGPPPGVGQWGQAHTQVGVPALRWRAPHGAAGTNLHLQLPSQSPPPAVTPQQAQRVRTHAVPASRRTVCPVAVSEGLISRPHPRRAKPNAGGWAPQSVFQGRCPRGRPLASASPPPPALTP